MLCLDDLCVLICPPDQREPRPPNREPAGRSGICHFGFVGETPYEGFSVEDVRFRPTAFLPLFNPRFSVGRIDDVIMHTSGEKTVPAPMEDIILSSDL